MQLMIMLVAHACAQQHYIAQAAVMHVAMCDKAATLIEWKLDHAAAVSNMAQESVHVGVRKHVVCIAVVSCIVREARLATASVNEYFKVNIYQNAQINQWLTL